MLRWDTPDRLRALLCQLVAWASGTGTPGEAEFPVRLADTLRREVPYFAAQPELVTPLADDEPAVFCTALYQRADTADTIILVSHYDTVGIAEYGSLEALACEPERLSAAMLDQLDQLDPDAAADARSGEYLFGRGTADMKAGLALHMSLVERASHEGWPINLLLLTVADEENASAGMRRAVVHLEALREQHDLRYVLVLNSEPSFPAQAGDPCQYIYSGSIGKLLPTALCLGRETHAGTPLDGLTSAFMASWLTQQMEWSDDFRDTAHGEISPLPITLWQRDLRDRYSTQTPSRTSVLYNVFVMRRSAAEVLDRFEQVARRAANLCTEAYHAICAREGVDPIGSVTVMRFDDLVARSVERFGAGEVDRLLTDATPGPPGEDLASQSIRMADSLLVLWPELAPVIVVSFAPPYYPAVDSAADPLVQACLARVTTQAASRFDVDLTHRHWFAAISDLSYVNHTGTPDGWQAYERNTPGFGATYSIPFEAMNRLRAPVLNVGPRGKDLHMRTERLHARSAFEELPVLLTDLVHFVAAHVRG